MKILPKKIDIDKAKAQERKKEIDQGIALAKKVDTLRELSLQEEQNLTQWRENAVKNIQQEIDVLIEYKTKLEKETDAARTLRNQLLEPLDAEWEEVNLEKVKINKEVNANTIRFLELQDIDKALLVEKEKISSITIKVKNDQKEVEKLKSEAIALKDMAEIEFDIRQSEHHEQTKSHDSKMSDLQNLQDSYESSILTNKIKEKQLEEKEEELITREKDILRQQERMKIVWNEMQK